MRRTFAVLTVSAFAAALGACANGETNLLTTSAMAPQAPVQQAIAPPADPVDPSCSPLAVRIDQLRQAQAVANLEKAAVGKTKIVRVKRDSLAQQAELNKANYEFQAKCMGPGQRSATTTQGLQTAPLVSAAAKPATAAAVKTAARAAATRP